MTDQSMSFEMLVSYAVGELNADDSRAMEHALRMSPAAAALVVQIRQVVDGLCAGPVKMPRRAVIDRAIAVFNERERLTPAVWLQSAFGVIARLLSDSRRTVAVAGFRGGTWGYQLCYRAGESIVDLQVTPMTASELPLFMVRGQLERDEPVGPSFAQLVNAETDAVIDQAILDDGGWFNLQAAPGLYNLVIGAGAEAIVVQKLHLE